MYMGREVGDIDEYYQDIWGDNFTKLNHTIRCVRGDNTSVHFADISTYHLKNYEWERCMYRIVEEIDPFRFNRIYVGPKIKSHLDKLGNGDDDNKVLEHLSLCKTQLQPIVNSKADVTRIISRENTKNIP